MAHKFFRRPDVESLTGLSRASIYRLMDDGEFPRPVRVGKRAVAWREADLELWANKLTETAT